MQRMTRLCRDGRRAPGATSFKPSRLASWRIRVALGALALAAAPGPVEAGSGFFLRAQSTSNLGSAQAGLSASAQDIGQMILNPSILTRFDGNHVVGTGTLIATRAEFEPDSATTILGTTIPGNDGGDSGTIAGVPSLYGMWSATPDLKLGIAVSSFFGLSSDWDDDWVGRYHALHSELLTFNINPVVAYRVNRMLSIGFGLQAEYADANLTSAVDFGTVDQVLLGGVAGGVPGGSDGRIRLEVDDWAFGATAGVLFEPFQGTRFGIGYRSGLSHELEGDAHFRLGGPVGETVAALTGAFTDTGVRSDFDLPDVVSFGFYQELGERWAVMGDAMWMNWSLQDVVRARFDNPAQPDQVTEQDWEDSWFFALGALYRPSPRWTLRFGAAYDQSPIPERTRTPIIADEDSYWVGIGAHYQALPQLGVDVAYGHIFVEPARIDLTADMPGNAFRGNLEGEVQDAAVDYVSVQVSYRF